MTSEIVVYGFIQVPYPYVESFQASLEAEKGMKFKNYPDFISNINMCRENALFSFGYSYVYEKDFDKVLLDNFVIFLKKVQFLTASLNLNVDEKQSYFFQFFCDGKDVFKYEHKVVLSEIDIKI